MTKAIVAITDTFVNKERAEVKMDVLCGHDNIMHCSILSDFGVWSTTTTLAEVESIWIQGGTDHVYNRHDVRSAQGLRLV